jgi:ArsR family transcriptional regulator
MTDEANGLELLKALSEPTRLKIIDMLSCGEMCACSLLEGLSITQSTLSHHMKVLLDCGLVSGRKEATWMYYKLDMETVAQFHRFIDGLTQPKENCVCAPYRGKCDC